MSTHFLSRREWIGAVGLATVGASPLSALAGRRRAVRRFHVCLSPVIVENDPDLLTSVRQAGVEVVWLAGYFYGHRPYADELIRRARARLEKAGLESELITVPLGHPGDSLGAHDGDFPLTPPRHWQTGQRPDGQTYAGTSLHAPATEENAAALRRLRTFGFRRAFVDDDFRLARGPGEIGGCFCAGHRERFLRLFGYGPGRWTELLEDVRDRRMTRLLRTWLDFTCDELTASFRAQDRAFGGDLGIMAMYLGAEKAGIRPGDYRRALFRVGELMFDDGSFAPVKGKTDELFSALFHRRFASPDRAFSETTAYPAHRLSARNMAAKLVISTLTDVRHTMFMSGLTPFPREHWAVLGPAMRGQGRLHDEIAGHRPGGPFKHFWGDAQRLAGDDQPFSLWLAAGVPFEVVNELPSDGWTFLSDFDARECVERGEEGRGTRLVCRAGAQKRPVGAEGVAESLPELFAFKNRIRGALGRVPHVAEAEPAVCAWYPTAGKVVVWNLAEEPRTLTLVHGARRLEIRLGGLEAASMDA
ncbi:MAG TPA: hypothetical protein PKM43_18395 [Verrucomicrobiota bacterium]|nr:hypothetical protein [Verrucomicrobiota bacterium]HRZ38235.1 hypothetical protein [Candidatus Paceibacterota bacterium]HRZ57192.1 hypothetical protein [Candidatus Paceibacterota bacterium]